MAGHNKALGLLDARRGEKQGSNYSGMGGRGIVRGRTDAATGKDYKPDPIN